MTDRDTHRDPLAGGTEATGEGSLTCSIHGVLTPLRHTVGDPVPAAGGEPTLPERLGRFAIRRQLGRGSYGVIYLAHDGSLGREVAIKVPRTDRIRSRAGLAGYIAEARNAAMLKHPSVVAIYDIHTDPACFFLVLEYVDGPNLAESLREEGIDPQRVVEVLIEVGEALAYAHGRGFVHRDLKPANILLDSEGHAHIADFGLAVHEDRQNLLRGQVAGTPSHMAPEQVRGETHRLDGRTDIWSVGVMMYTMLTGRHPFAGQTIAQLFEEIEQAEPRPLRQINRRIDKELERICLRALAKRMTDRYLAAADLVEDLRRWQEHQGDATLGGRGEVTREDSSALTLPSSVRVKVIPKGLRSFDANDADFFPELLPGPFDHEGYPESIRFWKSRIEERDPYRTFSVGLLYGPSGAGKSSLIRAGLLPNLPPDIRTIYLEATPRDLESRLLRGLQRCVALPGDLSLADALQTIREEPARLKGDKLLFVLDRFEQWLQNWQSDSRAMLVRALRQCDGQTVQCLLMVRDGFGMSAMRFLHALEVQVVGGENYATVDRFDLQHATRVLEHFGRAFGRLDPDGKLTADQQRFLQQAVGELAENGQVVPVRLALFAEMLRGKPWTPATLRSVGGTQGTGIAFLEESLGGAAIHPTHRVHQPAAHRVLSGLLPETGLNIRGRVMTRGQLLEASGYSRTPERFDELLRILDDELRLITPIDVAQGESAADAAESRQAETGYQLTHDYLVPQLRQWLEQKNRETRQGRAALLLHSTADLWSSRPTHRHLPSCLEFATIGLLTRRADWNARERSMMAAAARLHTSHVLIAGCLLFAAGAAVWAVRGQFREHQQQQESLVNSLLVELRMADWERVPAIAARLEPHREIWREAMAGIAQDPSRAEDQRLRAQLLLVADDIGSVPVLIDQLLAASRVGPRFANVYRLLSGYAAQIAEVARAELEAPAPVLDPGGEHETQEERRQRQETHNAAVQAWAERQAGAAIALLRQDLGQPVWPLLQSSPQPELRARLISRIRPCGVSPEVLIARLAADSEPSIRQAILLVLGQYSEAELTAVGRQGLIEDCARRLEWEPDAAVRAGEEWLLRQAGCQDRVEQAARPVPAAAGRSWDIDREGHVMIAVSMTGAGFGGSEQAVAAAGAGGQCPGDVTSQHAFVLSAHEVSIRQYLELDGAAEYARDVSPSIDCPMNKVSIFDAMRYCRWLSDRERLPDDEMCYPPIDEIGFGVSLPADFVNRTGYRLPTEAEWACACRAGTVTSRFCGEDAALLGEYAWYHPNAEQHLWPRGLSKPNPWGFFDLYGNVAEWCHSSQDLAGQPIRERRPIRGGAYKDGPNAVLTGSAEQFVVGNRTSFVGFRVARTIAPRSAPLQSETKPFPATREP